MAEMVYEGPDDVLVVGTVEMSRGVPVELPAALARVATGAAGVRPANTKPAKARRARGAEPAEGPEPAEEE